MAQEGVIPTTVHRQQTDLQMRAHDLFAPLGIRSSSTRKMLWEAFVERPDGTERCFLRAKAKCARSGAPMLGLLLKMIRDGDHRAELDPSAPIPTGWRFVRGTHSGTYVEDPAGVDPLPSHYDFRTRATGIYDRPPVEEQEVAPL